MLISFKAMLWRKSRHSYAGRRQVLLAVLLPFRGHSVAGGRKPLSSFRAVPTPGHPTTTPLLPKYTHS